MLYSIRMVTDVNFSGCVRADGRYARARRRIRRSTLALARRLYRPCPVLCALLGGAGLMPTTLAAIQLDPFEAQYSLYAKGVVVASITRRLAEFDDNSYEYRSETKTTGLVALFKRVRVVETSRFSLQGQQLRPDYYSYARSGGKEKRDVSVLFDWTDNRIKHTINGESWQMPAQPGVMDKLLYELAIRHDVDNGHSPVVYQVADGGGIRTYNFERLGEETISTPLGTHETIKMVRRKSNSGRVTVFWCAKDLDFLAVQVEFIEQDGSKTRAVINAIQK